MRTTVNGVEAKQIAKAAAEGKTTEFISRALNVEEDVVARYTSPSKPKPKAKEPDQTPKSKKKKPKKKK